ncbi:hypothetical protein [Terricaulis silvestris]|nr:hypothetical protein [Terricaulis silvestris]
MSVRLPPSDAAFADDQSLPPDERVRAAIEGYRLSYAYDGPPPHDAATGELFSCGDDWRRDGGRGGQIGTYRIDGDTICIEESRRSDRNVCRRFIRREGDRVFLDDPERGEIEYLARRQAYCAPDPAGGPSLDATGIDVRERDNLSNAELRALVRGSTFFTPRSGLASNQTFSCDGRWRGSAPDLRGRYRIQDDQLCLEIGPRSGCQKLFLVDGDYYAAPLLPDERAISALRFEVVERGACPR